MPAPAKRTAKPDRSLSEAQPRAAQRAPAAQGLTIARDADTGVLRAPTDSEAAALAAPAPAAPPEIVQFVTSTGAIAAMVPEELLTYTVVSKQADGTLTSVCLPDKQSAENSVMRAAAARPNQSNARTWTALRPGPGAPHE